MDASVDRINAAALIRRSRYAIPGHRKFSEPSPRSPDLLYVKQPKRSITPSSSPSRNRRFSNVSDVTRKISSTIGWRTVSSTQVVAQAKCLCSQYIRSRLKRNGLLNKKLYGLQRLRSLGNLSGGLEVCEVFPRVSGIGQEMERIHPKLYSSVARQLSITLTSEKVVRSVLLATASHLLRAEVSWARIVSLIAVSAAVASDCVKQGHPELVSGVIDAFGIVAERHMAAWIASQGGWSSLLSWSQAPEHEPSVLQVLVLVVTGLIVMAFTFILVLKFLGKLVI